MADTVQKILSVQLDANAAIDGIVRLNDAIATNNQQIKENNAAIKANNAAMQQSGADTQALARDNERLKKTNAELGAQTKELTAERRTLQREVQNEIRMESQQEGSLKSLRAELGNLTKQYDSLSRAERENINIGGKLKDNINKVTTEIKAAEEGTQRYQRNVGNYENAILNAIGLNGRFGSSLMGIAGAEKGVSGAFTAMGASAKAFGASLMALLTNPVFLAIAGIAGAGMAFKWFYDYNEGLAEATRLTREFTGYTGDELMNLRNEIRATSDVMGKDYKETLQAVDAIMSHFHVSGQEAIDIIKDGFAAGADVNGDFLSKVQQFTPAFHDAGIAADEMVAIFAQTRSGIFSDQGLEAIKQGSARIREMSSTTRQALQGIGINADEMEAKLRAGTMGTFDALKQVSAQLKTMPDDAQEVGQVMSAVFGRQGKFASQEMIESLADMSTSLDDVREKTGEYGDLLLENINTEKELDDVTSKLFDLTDKGWEEAKQKATIYAKKALIQVVNGIIDIYNWFAKLYNRSIQVRAAVVGFANSFKILWSVAKTAFNLIIDGFKTLGRAISGIVNMFYQAGQAIAAFGRGVALIFQGIKDMSWDTITKGVATIKNGVSSAVASAVDGLVVAAKESFTETSGDLLQLGKDMGGILMDGVETVFNGRMNEINKGAIFGGGGGGLTGANDAVGGDASGGSSSTGGGKGSKGGRASRGGNRGRTSSAKTTTKKTEKTPEEQAQEEYNKRVQSLVAEGEKLHRQALEAEAKESLAAIDQLAEEEKAAIKAKYGDREQYEGKALESYDAMLKAVEDKRLKAINDFYAAQKKKETEKAAQVQKEAQQLAENILAGQKDGSEAQLKWRLDVMRMQRDAELAELEANETAKTERKEWYEAMRAAIVEKYAKQETEVKQEYADKQREIDNARLQAASDTFGSLSQLAEAFGEENEAAVVASKTLALAQVMLAQAVAIANAVKAGSNATNPWQLIAQIAASVTAVTVAMVAAFKSLDNAKFATGGYVRGAGTSTSDSIPVRVSNGESIMNANTTAMFGGLLSSLNQLGGGVPIQVQQTATSVKGEDMLARAVARGVAMLPAPVVSVEDINRGQRQVAVMNERAAL